MCVNNNLVMGQKEDFSQMFKVLQLLQQPRISFHPRLKNASANPLLLIWNNISKYYFVRYIAFWICFVKYLKLTLYLCRGRLKKTAIFLWAENDIVVEDCGVRGKFITVLTPVIITDVKYILSCSWLLSLKWGFAIWNNLL